jgi:hypothetical protein
VSRVFWLALISLISLGVLFALRSNIGARPRIRETASVPVPSPNLPIDNDLPLAKADRLPSPYFDKPAARPTDTVQNAPATVQNAPAIPDPAITPGMSQRGMSQRGDQQSQPSADANDMTTWHWHAGSKITKRTTVAPSRK